MLLMQDFHNTRQHEMLVKTTDIRNSSLSTSITKYHYVYVERSETQTMPLRQDEP